MSNNITEGTQKLKGIRGLRSGDTEEDRKENSRILSELAEKYKNEWAQTYNNSGQLGYNYDPKLYEAALSNKLGEDFGSSKYDNKIFLSGTPEDVQNNRAYSQSSLAKIGAGGAKMGVLAGTTFLNSTLGLAVGIGTAIGEKRWSGLWDNEVSNALDEINKASEKLLPNYYSTEEMNTPWTNNIFTANFLGDKVLKNMGFTIGAIAAGSLTGGGINSLLGSAARSTGGKLLTRILAGAVSAAGEASIEGLNGANEFSELATKNVESEIQNDVIALDNEFRLKLEELDKKPDTMIYDEEFGTFTSAKSLEEKRLFKEYNERLGLIKTKKEIALEKIKEEREKVGNFTFGVNVATLMINNNLVYGRTLLGGFDNVAKGSAMRFINKETGEQVTENVAKGILKGTVQAEAKKGFGKQVALGATKNFFSEGIEESTQNLISNTAQIKAGYDLNTFTGTKYIPGIRDEVNSTLTAFSQALAENFLDNGVNSPGWEEFFLGGITGMTGVPTLKRGKPSWAGGIYEAYQETKDNFKTNDYVDKVNEMINKPDFINKYTGLIRSNYYQDLMNKAALDNNEVEYNSAETSQIINDVLTFNNANRIDILKDLISSIENISDDEVNKIIQDSQVLDENGKPTFKLYDNLDDSKVKEKIKENGKKLKDIATATINVHNQHLIEHKNTLSEEEIQELTWLKVSEIAHMDQTNTSLKNIKDKFNEINTNDLQENEASLINGIKEFFEKNIKDIGLILMSAPDIILNTIKVDPNKYADLLKQIDKLEKNTKNDKRNKKGAKELEKLNSLKNGLDMLMDTNSEIKKDIELFTVNILKAEVYREKYKNYTENKDSLKNDINEEKENFNKEDIKNVNTTNIDEGLKKESYTDLKKYINSLELSLKDKNNLLDALTNHKDSSDKLKELSKELKKVINAHNLFKSYLNQEDNGLLLKDEDKDNIAKILDNSFNTVTTLKSYLTLLKHSIDEIIYDKFLEVLNNNNQVEDLSKNTEVVSQNPKVNNNPVETSVTSEENALIEKEKQEKEQTINNIKLNIDEINTLIEANDITNLLPKIQNLYNLFTEKLGFKNLKDILLEIQKLNKDFIIDENTLPIFKDEFNTFSVKNLDLNLENNLDDITLKDFTTESVQQTELEVTPTITEQPSEVEQPIKKTDKEQPLLKEDAIIVDNEEVLEKTETLLNNTIDINNDEIDIKDNPNKDLRSDSVTQYQINPLKPENGRKKVEMDDNYKYLINFLNKYNAFDFVDSGKLAEIIREKPDTKIHFMRSKELTFYKREGSKNTPLSNVVLLTIEVPQGENTIKIGNKHYQIIGTLKGTINSTNEEIKGILEKTKALNFNPKENTGPEFSIVENLEYEIDKIYPGRIAIKEKNEPIKQLNDNMQLGIILDNLDIIAPNLKIDDVVLPNNVNLSGMGVLFIKGADGKFYPTPLFRKDFNDDTVKNTPVYSKIKTLLSTIVDFKLKDGERLSARDELSQILYFRDNKGAVYELNYGSKDNKHFIQFSKQLSDGTYVQLENSEGKKSINLTGNKEADSELLLTFIHTFSPKFKIDRASLNNEEHIKLLLDSEVLLTNLDEFKTHISNFTLKSKNVKNNPLLNKTSTSPVSQINSLNIKEGTEVKIGSTKYYISKDRKSIHNINGKLITDVNEINLILAIDNINKKENTESLNYKGKTYYKVNIDGTNKFKYLLKFGNNDYQNSAEKTFNDIKNLIEKEAKESVKKEVLKNINNNVEQVINKLGPDDSFIIEGNKIIINDKHTFTIDEGLIDKLNKDINNRNVLFYDALSIDILKKEVDKIKLIESMKEIETINNVKKEEISKKSEVIINNNITFTGNDVKHYLKDKTFKESVLKIKEALKLGETESSNIMYILQKASDYLNLSKEEILKLSLVEIESKINCK